MPQSALSFFARSFAGALGYVQKGQQNDLWESPRHGNGYGAAYGTAAFGTTAAKAGALFRGSNSSGATLSNGLAATYTGLCLSNPAASTVNLVVRNLAAVLVVAPAAFLGLGVITGWSAAGVTVHTTPLNTNITPAYVGAAASAGSIVGPVSQANLDAACTLVGTPLWDRWLMGNSVTAAPFGLTFNNNDDLIIPPGGYVAIGANAAGPSAGLLGTFAWEELAP